MNQHTNDLLLPLRERCFEMLEHFGVSRVASQIVELMRVVYQVVEFVDLAVGGEEVIAIEIEVDPSHEEVTLERSNDLVNWEEALTEFVPVDDNLSVELARDPEADREFFRLRTD